MTPAEQPRIRRRARGSALFLTNAIKLAGLIFAVREFLRPNRDPAVLAVAAFMMSGAQISEEILLAFIDSFLGRSPREEPE